MKTRPDHRFLRSGIRASLSFFAGLLIHASAFAQLPYLFDFSSDPFAAGWTEVSVTGDQSWQYNASFNNVTMNPFSGGCQINEDWLITPAFDLTGSTDESLSFDIQRAFSGDNDLEVLYSTDYSGSGDPNAAAWSSITLITNQFFEDNSIPSNTSETFGPFSDLQSASTSAVYIAFKAEYISGGCATWRVADFALTSASEPAIFASPAALSGFVVEPHPRPGTGDHHREAALAPPAPFLARAEAGLAQKLDRKLRHPCPQLGIEGVPVPPAHRRPRGTGPCAPVDPRAAAAMRKGWRMWADTGRRNRIEGFAAPGSAASGPARATSEPVHPVPGHLTRKGETVSSTP